MATTDDAHTRFYLRNALKTVIARCERTNIVRSDAEHAQAHATALVARQLLFYDSTPNDVLEKWIDEHAEVQ
jgi:hypothetical protein